MKEKPKGCEGCPLFTSGIGFVLGGKLIADPVMLIQGQAPGSNEVESGSPFVGDAGFWLRTNVLGNAGIDADRVVFDNTLRCLLHGKSGEYPTAKQGRKEAETQCRQYDIWQNYPTVPLMAVGTEATQQYFTGKQNTVSFLHGHIEIQGRRVVGSTFHPIAVMREPNYLPLVVREFYNLQRASKNKNLLTRPFVHKGFVPIKRNAPEVALDLEWNVATGAITVIGFAYDETEAFSTFNTDQGREAIDVLQKSGCTFITHNGIRADFPTLGIRPDLTKVRDTLSEAHLVHAHFAELGLLDLGSMVRYYRPTGEWKRDKADLLTYNGWDTVYDLRLAHDLSRDIILTKQEHLVHEAKELAQLSADMVHRGIRIDKERLFEHAKKKVEAKRDTKKTFSFNPESPKQIKEFAQSVGIKLPNTQFETLQKYRGKHPEIDRLIDFREGVKLLTAWFPVEQNEEGDVIDVGEWLRPEWNPFGTNVDRWSSAGPNMQNLSEGGERENPDGSVKTFDNLRIYIIARDPDLELVSYDFSQIENRTVAVSANDKKMLEDFATGVDFHRLSASRMFNVRYEDVTKTQRYLGKRTVHATNYVETAEHLAVRLFGNRTRQSVTKAKELQALYFRAYPAIRVWHNSLVEHFERGNVDFRNPFGRLRYVYAPASRSTNYGIHHERQKRAAHFLGSSTAARITNRGGLNVRRNLGLVPLLIVHDELVYELPRGDEKIRKEIYEILHAPVQELDNMVIPVNIKVGNNYGEMKEIEPYR